ncbi:cytidylyltransferase domain-containing protein [Arcobacter sp.]|uniref:acylneuraminate cytidylyltransferase family protein n=1 Tax=Arcobacter sp. TaxID=1872629 RepID=UPI003D1162AE
MFKKKKFLAVIPARGGSKRLPKKNILDLAGKPLIAWSIEAGLRSKYIDDVIVTSDCDDILKISKEYGAKTLKRPQELAQDTTTTFDTIMHTLQNTEQYDFIVLLQPTSPLRTEVHIDEAIELLDRKNAEAVISICEMAHSPLWSNTLPVDDSMENFINEEIKNTRSQDLPKYFRLNGAIYICRIENFLREKSFFIKKNIFGYKMDQNNSIDIDTKLDFEIAKVLKQK